MSAIAAALMGDGSPVITIQPYSRTVIRGALVRLHARAVGREPMSYQWQRNGQDLPGATQPSLVLANAQGPEVGRYRLVVTNAIGRTISATATITVPEALASPTGSCTSLKPTESLVLASSIECWRCPTSVPTEKPAFKPDAFHRPISSTLGPPKVASVWRSAPACRSLLGPKTKETGL